MILVVVCCLPSISMKSIVIYIMHYIFASVCINNSYNDSANTI